MELEYVGRLLDPRATVAACCPWYLYETCRPAGQVVSAAERPLHTQRSGTGISAWHFNGTLIGSILNPLAGNLSEDIRKKGKGAKTGTSHDWRSIYLSQYDWLKGSLASE